MDHKFICIRRCYHTNRVFEKGDVVYAAEKPNKHFRGENEPEPVQDPKPAPTSGPAVMAHQVALPVKEQPYEPEPETQPEAEAKGGKKRGKPETQPEA